MIKIDWLLDFFGNNNKKDKSGRKKKKEDSVTENTDKPESGTIPEPGKKLTRKEKKKAKKARKKARPLPLRMLIQLLKTIFIRIPVLVIVLFVIVLFFLQLYLTPSVVEALVKNNFNKMSYGTLDLKVESFDIYRGFAINNIEIRSGEDFGRAKLFEMKRLAFRYGIFPIFTGSIRFPEIGIYKPRVYLAQKKGVWNVSALMKPSEKKPEKEKKKKEEEKPEKEPSSEIKLPISVDFLFNFILDDLCVFVNGQDFNTEITGLSFNANIDIPPFKRIPKSVEAVRILKTMKFELNPRNDMNVKFYSKQASTTPELILNWRLVFNNGQTPEFSSTMNIGAKRMPLRLKDKFFSPFNFLVSYDIFYNPIKDVLELNDFTFSFMNSNWIKMSGAVNSVTKTQGLNIKMEQSLIPLKDLYPYFVLMTGDRKTKFGGEISLYPLLVRGTAKNPDIKGSISMKNIYFRKPGLEASIPHFAFNYSAVGSGSTMYIGAGLDIPHLAYVIEGSKSGDNGVKLTASATGYNNFKNVKINGVGFDFFSPEKGKALSLNLAGDIYLGKPMHGWISIPKIRINTTPLTAMVPGRFRKQITSIPLKKPVDIGVATNFSLGEELVKAGLDVSAIVPDYDVKDLHLKAAVTQEPKAKRITLDKIYLGSKSMNLALNADGYVEMKKAPLSNSNLKVSFELNNPKMKSVFGPWNTSGMLKLSAGMKGDLETGVAKGSLEFKNFNLKNAEQMLEVAGFNMNFPFEYEFKKKKAGASYISVNQKQVIDSDQFTEKQNFTIASIKAKHPARNMAFEYMKDFSARMVFRDNVFSISNLRASIMDGSVYGRSILFNLADFKTENMEFNFILDTANINIGRLDDIKTKNISKEAELSFNANFSGRGLDINKELTATGYVSIYKIGQEFANRLMKGLNQEKGQSKLGKPVQFAVDNSLLIKSFDFRLDKGLVYTTVEFIRKAFSALITVDKSKVTFDRIPIQEYLRKVKEAK
jgi:hypothetical protein